MNAQDIRKAYLDFFAKKQHVVIPRALLVPQNDPSTLFTGSGMQPLIPYLLGEQHPDGTRLVDSQTCLRVQDIEEVGDNRHTTFFEMLGNWSLGDYTKKDQINWFWEFLTKEIGLDPQRIYVSCFIGDEKAKIPKDTESAEIWTENFKKAGVDAKQIDIDTEANGAKVGDQGGRIFFYGEKNWWCRAGKAKDMPVGEPGGPDTEMFYLFPEVAHSTEYGELCHVNCDCGRYIELGNSVFMEYRKTKDGFEKLPKQNVDYGGGLERIAAAAIDSPDVFKISLMWPIVQKLEELSGKKYDSHTNAMRVIADHLRGAVFLAVDGIVPSNKEQGYVMRRLMRRAILKAFDLGIEQNFLEEITPVIADLYHNDFPELAGKRNEVIETLVREEKIFRQTLRGGRRMLDKIIGSDGQGNVAIGKLGPNHAGGHDVVTNWAPGKRKITGEDIFLLYDTHGYPIELAVEEVFSRSDTAELDPNWRHDFDHLMTKQRSRSRTATKGEFKGGLADHSEITTKYHSATHLMYKALRMILGDGVVQRGSNITQERLRFDFSHTEKVTPEQLQKVEEIVNQQIDAELDVHWEEFPTEEAFKKGAIGAFGDRYGDKVKVYIMQKKDAEKPFSFEICGGPHVENTKQLGEGGKRFKILKEEASSAGVRRIKAALK